MSVDYEQLKLFVKEAMFTGGGINEPSAPEGIPHRMPAADTESPEQEKVSSAGPQQPGAIRRVSDATAARCAAPVRAAKIYWWF